MTRDKATRGGRAEYYDARKGYGRNGDDGMVDRSGARTLQFV
jgi:hypothetical protein